MERAGDVRAGVFVAVAVAVLAAATLWIVGIHPLAARKVPYAVWMETSGGVREGDRVRVSGVAVGRVESITLRAAKERPVVFQVVLDSSVHLTDEATARFSSDSLLSSYYLEVVPGAGEALEPGSRILGSGRGTVEDALAQVEAIAARATEVLDEVEALLKGVPEELRPLLDRAEALLSEDNTEALGKTLASLRAALEETAPKIPALIDRIDAATAEVGASAQSVPPLVERATSLLAEIETAVGEDGERLGSLLEEAEATLGSAGGTFSVVERNGEDVEATIRDLREAAANLKALSKALKERPSLLLRNKRQGGRDPRGDG